MHECYTYFLLMLSMACKCFFGFSINDIKRGGVRAGDGGALEAVFFRRRIFLSSSGETYSQDSGYDKCVNQTLGYQHDLRDRDPRRGIAA